MTQINDSISRPNFLIVSGNGRNTGKTSFICQAISSLSGTHQITAIKISPHFHPDDAKDIIFHNAHFIIRKEKDAESPKDSSRMLKEGAKQVFYLEVLDTHIKDAFLKLQEIADLSGPVICESGGLRNIIEPSLFIILNRPNRSELKEGFKKLSPFANKIVMFSGKEFNFSPEEIFFEDNTWKIK